ncbi:MULTISPECIES: NUDIX hydrolase [Thermoactinomyces]|jgi:ADP-ribose pyrophosphatase|uniref:NUDIX hydrolase n=1 Tax=Thermoactinomyces TaxID=2023 RepID=UPI0005073A34|nr:MULTISPECIES: NUDIX hydrolase [Thermoactinomyces]KFZ39633.1 ADP-ribose pyrophosphatase [Thermoactinomyces sp. Gus2-1]QCV55700.1 NUDIX hydrolase [Thermoactinomyces vulgaris]
MKQNLEEKTIATQKIFTGKVIDLQVDDVLLPNGNVSKREIVTHPGAVAVMALNEEDKLVLVRQFRKALEKTILEIPAGKLEKGEDPMDSARRELEEETGYQAGRLEEVVSFYTSPGFADEKIHLYWATGLQRGTRNPDEDEFVELVELTMEECFKRIETGEICDAKTIFAVYYWKNRVEAGNE